MSITKEKLNEKLEALQQNKLVVEDRIKEARDAIQKGSADLNAILGATQVVEQLISELPADEEVKDEQD